MKKRINHAWRENDESFSTRKAKGLTWSHERRGRFVRRAFGGIKRRNKVARRSGSNRIRVTEYGRGRGERKSCGGCVSLALLCVSDVQKFHDVHRTVLLSFRPKGTVYSLLLPRVPFLSCPSRSWNRFRSRCCLKDLSRRGRRRRRRNRTIRKVLPLNVLRRRLLSKV